MITSAIPKLPFINKQQTIDYYVKTRGFTLQSDYGDYIIMELAGTELHFFSYPGIKPQNSDFMVYLRVDKGIEKFYQKLQDNNIIIHPNGEPEVKPWNQKEFSISDPNGTLLTFGQATALPDASSLA